MTLKYGQVCAFERVDEGSGEKQKFPAGKGVDSLS